MRRSGALREWVTAAGGRGPRTLPAFAALLGTDRRHAYRWVLGEYRPSLGTLEELAEKLGTTPGRVLDACLAARARREARLAAERVRREASGRED